MTHEPDHFEMIEPGDDVDSIDALIAEATHSIPAPTSRLEQRIAAGIARAQRRRRLAGVSAAACGLILCGAGAAALLLSPPIEQPVAAPTLAEGSRSDADSGTSRPQIAVAGDSAQVRQSPEVRFARGSDAIALRQPTRNPNVTIVMLYHTPPPDAAADRETNQSNRPVPDTKGTS